MVTKPRNGGGGGGQCDSDRLLFLIFKESINFFSSCEKVATSHKILEEALLCHTKMLLLWKLCRKYHQAKLC